MTVEMEETVLPLQEITVSGSVDPTAGVKLPYTVARVGSEQLQVSTTSSALQMIAGKVAGAYITRGSGKPGQGVNIFLRSPTGFESNNSPLIVVDGVILARDLGNTTSDLETLDIESFEVIKGAAAASLYGSRAAAGVISITTNRGRNLQSGQTRITSRTEFGKSFLGNEIPVTQSHHYRLNEEGTALVNASGEVVTWGDRSTLPPGIQDQPYPGQTYDNLHALYNPGRYLSQAFTFSHAAENTTFLASLSRRDDAGALAGNDGNVRNIGRFSIDHRIGDKMSLSLTGQHTRTYDDNISGDPYEDILTYPVYVDLKKKDADGNYVQLPDSTVEIENPLWRQGSRDNFDTRARTLGSFAARYALLPWFSLDAQVSYDRADSKAQIYVPKGTPTSVTEDDPSDGRLDLSHQENTAYNGHFGGTLIRQFGDLNARLTARTTFEREYREGFDVDGRDFIVNDTRDVTATREVAVWNSNTQDTRAQAYLADLGLDFRDRYIASLLIRRDGSSLFGPQEKWHTYRRASAKYRISEEPWFNVGFIDELGLRYAMGEAGGRPGYTWQYEQWNVSRTAGLTRVTAGNPQLKPHFTREQEFGIDLIAFNNRVQLELVYARQTSKDQIIVVPSSTITGYNSVRANAGLQKGRTYEMTLQAYPVRTPTLSWSVQAVADNTETRLVEFDRGCYFGSNSDREHEFTCAGERMGDFWMQVTTKRQDELPPWLQDRADEFVVNDEGYLVWVGKDVNTGQPNDWRDGLTVDKCRSGNTCWGTTFSENGFTYRWGEPFRVYDADGVVVRRNMGTSLPDLNFGFLTNLRYRNFTAFAAFRGQLGGQIYSDSRQWFYNQLRHGDMDQRGKPDELKKTFEYYRRGIAQNNSGFVDSFLEDATHLKFSELTVRYRFTRDLLQKFLGRAAPSDLTLGMRASELFTLTSYRGFNPEAGSALSRVEEVGYPHLRTLTATVDITF
jgi:TonB-linked SusC/RagA family outer membrane protein